MVHFPSYYQKWTPGRNKYFTFTLLALLLKARTIVLYTKKSTHPPLAYMGEVKF